MALVNLNPDAWQSQFNQLKETKQDFEEVETRKKSYLVWNGIKFYRDENPVKLQNCDLGIVSKAKKEIQARLQIIKPLPDNLDKDFFIGIREPNQYTLEETEDYALFKYFGGEGIYTGKTHNQIKSPTITEGYAVQIDINAAYLTAVKNRGLLSEATYKQFFVEEADQSRRRKNAESQRHQGHEGEIYRYSKDARLIAVGSLAVCKDITYYRGGEIHSTERQYNEKEANVFFTAAADVGALMFDILKSCKGYFFWVDAVFVPAEMADKAAQILKQNGYNSHRKTIYLKQNGGNFESQEIDTETGEITKTKLYSVPSGRTPNFVEAVNDENFLKEIAAEYLEAKRAIEAKEIDAKEEELNALLADEILQRYNLDSALNIAFLSEGLDNIGLKLSDLIKLEVTIEEQHKDIIFQSEVLQTIIYKRLELITQRPSLPPMFEATEETYIERKFYFRKTF